MMTLTLSPTPPAETSSEAPIGPPANTCDNPETISAEELHRLILRAYVLGARVRLRFLKALLALHRTRLYIQLGFSSTTQYAARYFGYQKSQTYESLRVAEALERLPITAKSFSEGSISWSAVREITRVAAPETEKEWVEFASKKSIEEVRAEVLDALKKNRKLNRPARFDMVRLAGAFPPWLCRSGSAMTPISLSPSLRARTKNRSTRPHPRGKRTLRADEPARFAPPYIGRTATGSPISRPRSLSSSILRSRRSSRRLWPERRRRWARPQEPIPEPHPGFGRL